jgi:hypothetical protein
MRLADRIAQTRLPFYVRSANSAQVVQLNGVADYADQVLRCPTRYVLSDDLTRLCTALAYSKGARSLACADLLHVPAECVWVEWSEAPWREELERNGFGSMEKSAPSCGRRGALILTSRTGRRGPIKTFWSGAQTELDVTASSMEAYFDFDTPDGEEPESPDDEAAPAVTVFDDALGRADILRRCFRFRFERTWADYYARAALSPMQMNAIARHALGTIAIDIPVLLTFLVLLMSRSIGHGAKPGSGRCCRISRSRRRFYRITCPAPTPDRAADDARRACITSAGIWCGEGPRCRGASRTFVAVRARAPPYAHER